MPKCFEIRSEHVTNYPPKKTVHLMVIKSTAVSACVKTFQQNLRKDHKCLSKVITGDDTFLVMTRNKTTLLSPNFVLWFPSVSRKQSGGTAVSCPTTRKLLASRYIIQTTVCVITWIKAPSNTITNLWLQENKKTKMGTTEWHNAIQLME
jgi:hypothetical protein